MLNLWSRDKIRESLVRVVNFAKSINSHLFNLSIFYLKKKKSSNISIQLIYETYLISIQLIHMEYILDIINKLPEPNLSGFFRIVQNCAYVSHINQNSELQILCQIIVLNSLNKSYTQRLHEKIIFLILIYRKNHFLNFYQLEGSKEKFRYSYSSLILIL